MTVQQNTTALDETKWVGSKKLMQIK